MGKWRYGVILDAGSSGTRVHIYRWLHSDVARKKASDAQLHSLPIIKTDKDWTKKIHPGISTFGDKPNEVGPDHLQSLFEHALEIIPADEVPNTPFFLFATAGMRMLPPLKQKAILKNVCDYAKKNTRFQLPDCDLHIQVIPGETEGLYGWIAANYLLGGFDDPKDHDHGKGHHTYGFLDMGGASAQIAFAPNATEAEKHANDLTLLRLRTVDGQSTEYKVFVTTWLGFGVNQARQRFVKALLEASPGATELPDPCLPAGLKLTTDGKAITSGSDEDKGETPHLIGTGRFPECMSKAYPLLEKDKPCPDTPCLINGQHSPAIDFDVNHFVGVSEYWHTTHEIFEVSDKHKAYDFKTYQLRVNVFCSQSWEEIQRGVEMKKWGKKVDETAALEVCFKASWLINVLHDGIGVPRVGLERMNGTYNGTKSVFEAAKSKGFADPFKAYNKIDDVEVSWTLGKMVLYASSEVPSSSSSSSTNALAIGFGSNVPGGLHKDFQYAGGTYQPYEESGEIDDFLSGNQFAETPRRIPGYFMLSLVFAAFLIGYLLWSKDRRTIWLRRTFLSYFFRKDGSPSSSRRKHRFPGKLFGLGTSTPSYERILEDGSAGNRFELGSIDSYEDNEHSDSSEGSHSRVGRTSGWATPQIQAGFVDPPGTPTYLESNTNIMAQGMGLGLSPPNAFNFANPIDRTGLMSRTESRERLVGGVGSAASAGLQGRKSRNASPSRLRSPGLKVMKQWVD